MNPIKLRNSRFSSTFAFAFTCALFLSLTLTWVLSLREVRLKIGNYYSNQGKYDQAVNWYQTQPTQSKQLK
jgi:hypothetical protein